MRQPQSLREPRGLLAVGCASGIVFHCVWPRFAQSHDRKDDRKVSIEAGLGEDPKSSYIRLLGLNTLA